MKSKTNIEIKAGGDYSNHNLLCPSIPSCLPDGRRNPEYSKAYRKTANGRAQMDKWNNSEKGKAATAKYVSSEQGKRKRRESGKAYASRIIREVGKISQHNAIGEARVDSATSPQNQTL